MIQINANVSGFGLPRQEPPRLYNDSPSVPAGRWTFDEGNARGNWQWDVPIPSNGWTLAWADQALRVWLSLDETHVPLPPGAYELALLKGDANQPMPAVLAYQAATLSAIRVAGVDLVTEAGRWTYNGATHFLALLRLLCGGEVIDYAGANVYRVFGSCVNVAGQAGLPRLDPDAFPNYFAALEQLADQLGARGIYLDFCALADVQLLGKTPAWCVRFVEQCAEVIGTKANVLFDLGNEPWNNGFDPAAFARPGIPNICSRGSIQDASGRDGFEGPGVAWEVIRVHPRRDFPKMLTHCALPDPLFTYGKPIIVDEPFKCGEHDIGGKQYTNPQFFRIAGALGRAVNGICFHTEAGCLSLPLGGVQDACRAAFFGDA